MFDPETSWYHSVLLKTYGEEKARQMIGAGKLKRRQPIPKTCLMCNREFFTKSQRKKYCGLQSEEGTCSYNYRKNRKPSSITNLNHLNHLNQMITSYAQNQTQKTI